MVIKAETLIVHVNLPSVLTGAPGFDIECHLYHSLGGVRTEGHCQVYLLSSFLAFYCFVGIQNAVVLGI